MSPTNVKEQPKSTLTQRKEYQHTFFVVDSGRLKRCRCLRFTVARQSKDQQCWITLPSQHAPPASWETTHFQSTSQPGRNFNHGGFALSAGCWRRAWRRLVINSEWPGERKKACLTGNSVCLYIWVSFSHEDEVVGQVSVWFGLLFTLG